MMISLVILKESAAGLSITLVVTPVSGFVKFQQQDGTKIWKMPQKSQMPLSERWLCTGQEGFVHSRGNVMDFTEQVLGCPCQPSSVVFYFPDWSHHRAMSTWHCSPQDKGICQAPAPSAPSLIPAGAVQAQSYLLTSLTPRLPWKNAFLLCQWWHLQSSSTLCFSRGKFVSLWSGNDVHETFITSDFGRTSYKML